jgi:glycosyltransferase involved in cell wall biosynthesis
MRILIDATAAMSGGKVYLAHLLPQLARLAAGHELIVLHNGDLAEVEVEIVGSAQAAQLRMQRVEGLAATNRVWIGKAIVKLFWRLVVFPWHLWRLQPDVLFSNAGYAPGWMPSRTKLVLALHNSMPLRTELIAEERSTLRRWRLRLLRRLMGRAARRSAATIVFSHDTRQRVRDSFDIRENTLAVVHHGIDWGAAERAQPLDEDVLRQCGLTQPYLLFVSQFHRYKNLGTLVEAFAQVHQRQSSLHPELQLALVGDQADAEYWRETEAQIAALGLTDSIVQVPACARESLQHVYRGALAFVHPSLAETCSFPLLEALALGVPVAVARMSALPEIAGEAALYFDPHNAAELAAVLERLVGDEALRGELSQKAIKRAQMFTWEVAARQTLEVLEAAGRRR